MKRGALVMGLVLALMLASRWTGRAQTTPPQFTGKTDSLDAKDLSVARRSFEPGARTFWHSHAKGQLIFAEQGRGLVQRKAEAIKELKQGDSDYTAPDVVHWHGATPDGRFVQINVGFTGETKWLPAVTDAEYNGRRQR
jgi:quercetin dioxygenase-like cupin family protein